MRDETTSGTNPRAGAQRSLQAEAVPGVVSSRISCPASPVPHLLSRISVQAFAAFRFAYAAFQSKGWRYSRRNLSSSDFLCSLRSRAAPDSGSQIFSSIFASSLSASSAFFRACLRRSDSCWRSSRFMAGLYFAQQTVNLPDENKQNANLPRPDRDGLCDLGYRACHFLWCVGFLSQGLTVVSSSR
jgi:hypothetical protein